MNLLNIAAIVASQTAMQNSIRLLNQQKRNNQKEKEKSCPTCGHLVSDNKYCPVCKRYIL